MRIILLGGPGSGKGTQADVLSKEIGLVHISSGDLFREAQKKGTELGLKAKEYMEKGQLVPDEITIQMILERIGTLKSDQDFMLDGFPRTIEQAQALDKALAAESKAIDKVMYVKVEDEELLRRLSGRWICRQCQTPFHMVSSPPKVEGKCDKCGGELYQRADDTRETAEKRLGVFVSQTAPLIDYYQKQSKLVEINGQQSIEEVSKQLIAKLR